MLPRAEHVERRLQQILRRGSKNVGGGGQMARLMVMLTRSCEMRCTYCLIGLTEDGYQKAHLGVPDKAFETGEVPRGDISVATMRRSIDSLVTSHKPQLGVQFFGGEPTRCWDVIVDAIDYALGHPGRQGREIELQITTNGAGLTPPRVEWLASRPVMVQFSLDGNAHGSRFRRGHLIAQDAAVERMETSVRLLNEARVPWFMNATLPPNAAGEVMDRYRWAREMRVPRLQMNYATGMHWSGEQVSHYLEGIVAMLRDHAAHPEGLSLMNWENGADPVPLCADVIVDVDGTVFQTGAIFHEKRYPSLKVPYRRAHLDDCKPFDTLRFSLAELWEVTRSALAPRDWAVFDENVRLGAATDLMIQLTAQHLGRRHGAR